MNLLDTHILWWLAYEPEKLSTVARNAIRDASLVPQGLAISCISLYEIAWLIEKGRLKISEEPSAFFNQLNRRFTVLPIDGSIAVEAARIPTPFHGDPMDRLIVATALAANLTLITADRSILASNACKLLW
jgi:PIN domain nuclease of toxin-antitoxin system